MTAGITQSLHVSGLFGEAALAQAIADGYVRRQEHPSLPYSILNYTEKCQWERAWDDVTRQCRGLIVDAAGQVIARPRQKLFNNGGDAGAARDQSKPAEVTDKMDGSLGICHPVPDGWAIATRGSFASEQAIHATAVLQDRYGGWQPPAGVTALFEIIYPANRIVLDYRGMDDLVLLGAVDIATGQDVPMGALSWPGPQAPIFDCGTLASALALPPRPNAEGVVVRILGTDVRVKLKQEDYIQLHRLITGLNARVVWERLGSGETEAGICEALPDEFHAWVSEVAAELFTEQARIVGAADAEHHRIASTLPSGWTRKDYALEAVKSPLRAWLFMLLDGRDPAERIWHTLRPSGERSLVAYGEDVA